MPKGTRKCMICGKEYPYCHTNRPNTTFRWQEVGCCPDHAEQFFIQIMKDSGDYNDENKVTQMRDAIRDGRVEYARMNQ